MLPLPGIRRNALDHLSEAEIKACVRGIATLEKLARVQRDVLQCDECREKQAFYERLREVVLRATGGSLCRTNRPDRKNIPTEELPGNPEAAGHGAPDFAGKQWMDPRRRAFHYGTAKYAFFECGDFDVELRSEKQPGTVLVSLVGQLAYQGEPHRVIDSVQVRLVAVKTTLQLTECNRLGEFVLSFAPARRLHLEIELPGQHSVLIVLLGGLNSGATST